MMPDTSVHSLGSSRIYFLDGIRGIAAISVMLSHCIISALPSYFTSNVTLNLGRFGVGLFFLCSGFIITASIEHLGDLRSFWIKRFFRLYPLYWFNIGLWLMLVLVIKAGSFQGDSFNDDPVSSIMSNMTMLQIFWGVDHLVPLYWTLSVELSFYIFASAIYKSGIIKQTTPIALMLLCSAILVNGVIPLIYDDMYIAMLSYMSTIFVGAVFYRMYTGETSPRVMVFVLLFAIGMEVITTIAHAGETGRAWDGIYILPAQFGSYLVFAAALKTRTQRTSRFTLYLGLISYSVYLMHMIAITMVPRIGGPFTTIFIWILSALIISSLTYYLIERPGMAIGRSLIRHKTK